MIDFEKKGWVPDAYETVYLCHAITKHRWIRATFLCYQGGCLVVTTPTHTAYRLHTRHTGMKPIITIKEQQCEIDNAPEWATDFAIIKDQVIMIGGGQITKPEGQKLLWAEVLEADFKPIPRKGFDIDEYDFCDESVTCGGCGIYDIVNLNYEIDTSDPTIYIEKQDAVALAKHFKLTIKDLL